MSLFQDCLNTNRRGVSERGAELFAISSNRGRVYKHIELPEALPKRGAELQDIFQKFVGLVSFYYSIRNLLGVARDRQGSFWGQVEVATEAHSGANISAGDCSRHPKIMNMWSCVFPR